MSTSHLRALTFDDTRTSIAALLLKLADIIAPPTPAAAKPAVAPSVEAPGIEAQDRHLAVPSDALPSQLRLTLGWRAAYYD